ncbi:tryptophan synthase subunit alpha [Solibacillus merdavium]|uniref:Tryptophan synthase alpha chain n=1 Tax=Solibacillus merdavium TaxID=2762218 RepID=A0ABR8XL99_9BACL|nr:tryptophan synthase subunit alpha [Solibacillus merdavium]MBD8032681.1 tryptophan synthase subunit alpha [Solibacillus merdavium]
MTLQKQLEDVLATGDKAFVPYIMAGDRGIETLKPTILKLQQIGVSAVEVGIPFTDPVADGPTIEQAGERALAHGITLRKVLAELTSFSQEIHIPLVVMTYLNPILAYGIEDFAKDAKLGGVQGLIVPDMPFEESALLHTALKEHGIALVQLVSLTSPVERIKKLAAASEGFIYAVTVNGITGERVSFATELAGHFANLKAASNIPVLAGFGISTIEHVKSFGDIADGVIVGSKIVTALVEQDWATIEALVQATKKATIN